MRGMSVACVISLASVFGAGCTAEDKVLAPDETNGDGGGVSPGSDGGGNGSSNGADGGNNGATATGGDGGGSTSGGTPSDAECDMNGIWIADQVTRSEALLQGQFSNNWYYLEIAQNGEAVTVTKHFDCGIEVCGSVKVILSRASADALREHNIQTGREGTMKKVGATCEFKMDRFWSIRGASEAMFAPTPRNSTQAISELRATNPIPTAQDPDGAEDWDNDGKLGSAWQVSGVVKGVRNTVQRDWTEWFTDSEYTITPALDFTQNLVVRAKFDAEEQIFDPTSGLITQLSTTDAGVKHTLTLRFLGRDRSDSRVKAIVKAEPFETCRAIQAALPAQTGL